MDFQELISDFATRHGIANLAAEDNAAALDVDGIVVTLVGAGDALSLSAEIGEPPSEGRAEFAELLLESNLRAEAFFAKESERGVYILVRRLSLPTLDAASFDAAFEAFINMAETWCKLLSDFRPVAAAAAEHVEEAPNFGTHGFMQV
ncbi:MAG: type III secretion system chaperone [Paludibacteraceae bacterium]|nr:type III secretion system chaperone [Paludibacteraceae bacterium]